VTPDGQLVPSGHHGEGTPSRDVAGEDRRDREDPRDGLYFQGPDGRARWVSPQALQDTFGAAFSSPFRCSVHENARTPASASDVPRPRGGPRGVTALGEVFQGDSFRLVHFAPSQCTTTRSSPTAHTSSGAVPHTARSVESLW